MRQNLDEEDDTDDDRQPTNGVCRGCIPKQGSHDGSGKGGHPTQDEAIPYRMLPGAVFLSIRHPVIARLPSQA